MAPDPDGLAVYRASPRVRMGVGAVIVIALVALAATVLLTVLRSGTEHVPEHPQVTVTDAVYVHVGGAVRAPGLYRLPADARVVDAIAAALGFADDAARDTVNLARAVSDGEQLIVPTVGELSAESPGAATVGDGRINLNTAAASELEELPRIGPALAERIVQWRTENGRFASVDDLLAVSGIGAKLLEGLRPLVTV